MVVAVAVARVGTCKPIRGIFKEVLLVIGVIQWIEEYFICCAINMTPISRSFKRPRYKQRGYGDSP